MKHMEIMSQMADNGEDIKDFEKYLIKPVLFLCLIASICFVVINL